jgi:hypothetical protein
MYVKERNVGLICYVGLANMAPNVQHLHSLTVDNRSSDRLKDAGKIKQH